MSNNDLVYVGHMLDTARKAVALIEGKDRTAYDRDEQCNWRSHIWCR